MNAMKTPIIEVAPIHDVEGTGFDQELIQNVNVVHCSIRDEDEGRDASPEVQKGVCSHRRLGLPKMGPGEYRETEINRRGIQGVILSLESLQDGRVIPVEQSSPSNEDMSEGFIDPPVTLLIGQLERGPDDGTTEAHVVKLLRVSIQAEDDTPYTLSVCELSKAETEKLLPARKDTDPMIPSVCRYALLELITG